MNRRIRGVFRRVVAFVADTAVSGINRHRRTQRGTNQLSDNFHSQNQEEHEEADVATPTFSQSSTTPYERATLVGSSSITFGNECLRLVNIAVQTSQTFPLMMNTCASVSQYLRNELMKQHPNEYFDIIIGENNAFGFAISDESYFAEIEQEQYRVLIFTTERRGKVKYGVHDANSQMKLEWKSILVKSSK